MPKKQRRVLDGLKLREITPKTDAQADLLDAWKEGYHLLLQGYPGTGKSFLSMFVALGAIFDGLFQKLVIVRSVVPSREMGFLPGTIGEKAQIYEFPYQEICSDLFQRKDAYETLKLKGAIEFLTTSFERGITINNAIVLIDEIQNMTFQELDTTVTRVGQNCRVILSGDINQSDLFRKINDISGLPDFVKIIQAMESFDCVEFEIEDVVRSGFVKEYLLEKTKQGIRG